MELVYLWVEEYKNIENQGFNFSSNFDVKFTPVYEDKKLSEKSELKITPKENPLKDFFGKNINITAIVGENGSGKSSILQTIFAFLSVSEYFFIYQIKDKDKIKLYYAKTDEISVDFGNLEIEKAEQSSGQKQNNSYNNFKTIFYNDNLFNDNLLNGTHEINPKTLIEELFKKSKDSSNFTEKLNNLMVKKILELLKRDDVKGLDLKYKPLYILVTFHRITGDIENIFSSYTDDKYNNSYIIPYDKLKDYEDIWNQLDYKRIDFKISFKYEHNINETHPNSISISSMPSHGEMSFLFLLSSIYSTLKPIKYHFQNDHEEYFGNNIIIYLDEPMNYLHPNWQKDLIRNLINFLRANFQNINFHLILTTHSPFILSDIPKENVIFLDKVDEKTKEKYPKLNIDNLKNGNCINVSDYVDIKPFGANIHTLLSDGFFMKDGLMGEFAKGKIEEIKKFYELIQKLQNKRKIKSKNIWKKSYERRKIRFENIQRIIGEPFLNTIMKNYLDELEQTFDKEAFKKKKIDSLILQFGGKEELQKYLEHNND